MAGPTSSGLNIQHEIVDVAADLLTEFYNQPLPQQRDEVVERIENEIVVMQQRLRRVAQLRSQQRVSAERRRRRETGDPFHSRSSSPSSDSSSEESDDEEDDSPSGGGAGPAPIAAYSYYVVMIQQLKRVIEVYRYERYRRLSRLALRLLLSNHGEAVREVPPDVRERLSPAEVRAFVALQQSFQAQCGSMFTRRHQLQ
eukprot:Selendium_serpulae@DN5204_c2_g1_i13.p1